MVPRTENSRYSPQKKRKEENNNVASLFYRAVNINSAKKNSAEFQPALPSDKLNIVTVSYYKLTPQAFENTNREGENLLEEQNKLMTFVTNPISEEIIERVNRMARHPLVRKAILKSLRQRRKYEQHSNDARSAKSFQKDKLRAFHYTLDGDTASKEQYFKSRLKRYMKEQDIDDLMVRQDSKLYIPEMEKIAHMPGRYIKEEGSEIPYKGMTSLGIVYKKKAEFVPDKPYKYLSLLYMQKLASDVMKNKKRSEHNSRLSELDDKVNSLYQKYSQLNTELETFGKIMTILEIEKSYNEASNGKLEGIYKKINELSQELTKIQSEIEDAVAEKNVLDESLQYYITSEERDTFFKMRRDQENKEGLVDILEYVKTMYPKEYEKIRESKKKRLFRSGENVYDPFKGTNTPSYAKAFHIIQNYVCTYTPVFSFKFIQDFVSWFLFIAKPDVKEGELYNIKAFENNFKDQPKVLAELFQKAIIANPKVVSQIKELEQTFHMTWCKWTHLANGKSYEKCVVYDTSNKTVPEIEMDSLDAKEDASEENLNIDILNIDNSMDNSNSDQEIFGNSQESNHLEVSHAETLIAETLNVENLDKGVLNSETLNELNLNTEISDIQNLEEKQLDVEIVDVTPHFEKDKLSENVSLSKDKSHTFELESKLVDNLDEDVPPFIQSIQDESKILQLENIQVYPNIVVLPSFAKSIKQDEHTEPDSDNGILSLPPIDKDYEYSFSTKKSYFTRLANILRLTGKHIKRVPDESDALEYQKFIHAFWNEHKDEYDMTKVVIDYATIVKDYETASKKFAEYCNNEFRRIIKEKERGSQRIFYPVPSHYYPPTADGDKLYYGLLKILGYIKKTYEPYMHKISMSRVDYIHGIDEIEKKYQTEETWKLVPQARIAHEEMIKGISGFREFVMRRLRDATGIEKDILDSAISDVDNAKPLDVIHFAMTTFPENKRMEPLRIGAITNSVMSFQTLNNVLKNNADFTVEDRRQFNLLFRNTVNVLIGNANPEYLGKIPKEYFFLEEEDVDFYEKYEMLYESKKRKYHELVDRQLMIERQTNYVRLIRKLSV